MAFAQLTYREGLRDIEACLRSSPTKLYHMGVGGRVSKSTLADANERHDWRIFADFAQIVIGRARTLYMDDPFGEELRQSAYALDSTTIKRLTSRRKELGDGVMSDQIVVLATADSRKHYPDKLRRIRYHDAETNRYSSS